jgi:transcriptional regulator with XRE-family HTH domain
MKTDFVLVDKSTPIASALEDKRKREKKIQEMKIAMITDFHAKCIYHRFGTETTPGPNDYKTGSNCGNIFGDRVKLILEKEGMTIKELADSSGVARSSLHRFLDPEDADIPKVATMEKIIGALPIHLDDFVHSPDSFAIWEKDYISGYVKPFGDVFVNYGDFKRFAILDLSTPLAYEQNGKKYQMPTEIVDLLSKQILSAFETADALLEYEMEKRKPQGYFKSTPKVELLDE